MIGLVITSISISILSIQVLSVLINNIMNKKIVIKKVIYILLSSFIGLIIGTIILFFDIKSYKIIKSDKDKPIIISEVITMNESLIISDYGQKIKYIIDDSLNEQIKIELIYKKNPINMSINIEDNNVNFIKNNIIDFEKWASGFITNLKNKKIYIYDFSYNINVYASNDNVQNIIKNASRKFFLDLVKNENEIVVTYISNVSEEMICQLGVDSLYHCSVNEISNSDDCSCLYNNQLNLIDCSNSPKCSCTNNICNKTIE